jgi:ATP-dependent helicase HrpB
LYQSVRDKLASLFGDSSTPESLRRRVELLTEYGKVDSKTPPLDDQSLLRQACDGLVSLAELEQVNFSQLVNASLGEDLLRSLRKECPEQLALPGGRSLRVNYEPGKPPWIASRLQDFFGMKQSPTILSGRLALTVHLLAPNQRAVQVTSDLAGFWTRHYPEIRKELMRRYPRHAWPEDGANAQPPPPLPPRRR